MFSGLSSRPLSSNQQQKVQGKDLSWEDSNASAEEGKRLLPAPASLPWHVSGSHTANHYPQQTNTVFTSPLTAVLTSKAFTFTAAHPINTTTISYSKTIPWHSESTFNTEQFNHIQQAIMLLGTQVELTLHSNQWLTIVGSWTSQWNPDIAKKWIKSNSMTVKKLTEFATARAVPPA